LPAVTVCENGDAEIEKLCEPVGFTTKLTIVVCERLGLVLLAVTVIVYVPAGVDVDVAKVMVEGPLPVTEVGLKVAPAPDGKPDAAKLTVPAKPFCAVMVTTLVPLVPCVTVTVAGDAETLKFGWDVAFTVRVTAVVSVVLPEVPLTVMLYVPAATDAATVSVMVEVPAPVIELGLKFMVTPVGCPVALKEMAELNPPATELVMAELPELPCATVTEDGEADKLKLGFDELPPSALIRPVRFGLPQPVAKSYPFVAE